MNFKTFPVATTTVFPLTNSKAGGQLVTEWNLRCRDMVPTWSEISYDVGPSFVHGNDDFSVDAHKDASGTIISNSTLMINPGTMIINGHYVKEDAIMTVDLLEANNELQRLGKNPLHGKLAIGFRAYYSTESSMIGSMEAENEEDVYVGIQTIVLPETQLITPEESPHDINKVTCHLKLATFQFIDNEIKSVTQNLDKIKYLDASRIKDIEDIVTSNSISNKGIQPRKLYALAGKGVNSKELINDTWTDATDSLFRWDPNPTLVNDRPKHSSAAFDVNSDQEVVLNLPHKPIDGMVSTIQDTDGNIKNVTEYYKEVQLSLPVADYTNNTAGTVDGKYTRNIKDINTKLSQSFQIMKGRQVAYIEDLRSDSTGADALPEHINDAWNAGDYVLVNRDGKVLEEENLTGLLRAPSTFYAVLPGQVKNIEFFAVVENSEQLPDYRTNDKLGASHVQYGQKEPLIGVQLGNTVVRDQSDGVPPTTRSTATTSSDVNVGVSIGTADVTPGSVEYVTNEGIIYDDSNSTSVEDGSSMGILRYSSKNANDDQLTLNAVLSNDYNANNDVTIGSTEVTFLGQKLKAYTIQVAGKYLHVSADRPYRLYLDENHKENDLYSCFFLLDPSAESVISDLNELHTQPVTDVDYFSDADVVVHGLNKAGNIVICEKPYDDDKEATNKTEVIEWDKLEENVEKLSSWSYSVIDKKSYEDSNGDISQVKLKSRINMSNSKENSSSDVEKNVMIYKSNGDVATSGTAGSNDKYAVAALSFGAMAAYYTTTKGVDYKKLDELMKTDPITVVRAKDGKVSDEETKLAEKIKDAAADIGNLGSVRGVEFATAALFFNEMNSNDGTAQTASSFMEEAINKGLPKDSNAVLKEIYAYCYRITAVGPKSGSTSDLTDESTIFVCARPNATYTGDSAQKQLWQILEQGNNAMLANSYFGSLLSAESVQDLKDMTYDIDYSTGIITGVQALGTASYSYTSKDVHAELMEMFNIDSDKVKGVKGQDYFVCRYEKDDGTYAMYYYVVTSEGERSWSEAVWLTGPTYLASEDVVGGFLNVPESALDAGYVYMNDQGHLQLLDYGILRSGVAAYQLGQDISITGGLSAEDIQEYLDEYINDRIAFPNSSQMNSVNDAVSSGTTGVYADPNVIHITVEISAEEEQNEIRICNIDCRFGTSIYLHITGNANSNTTIVLADIEKLRIDNSITYDEADPPTIKLYRCGLFYDPYILNLIAQTNGMRDSDDIDIDPLSYSTGIQGLKLWYNRWEDTDTKLVVDGLSVSAVDTPIVPVVLDFWNTKSPNDNQFKVALQGLQFSDDGTIVGCKLFIANDSTSNIQEGQFILAGDFEIPQSQGLQYPKNCLRHQMKVTGTFESGYKLGNQEYMIQTTNFTAITNPFSIYSASTAIKGNILFHITSTIIPALLSDIDLEAWSPDKYHVFQGNCISNGTGAN